jgi:uncharacterized Ntn-hydrolase superfamily protein
MNALRVFIIVIVIASRVVAGERGETVTTIRPVHTYSIVAYDSTTGQLGAAVQSHWFKVADVIWVEPGLGAVATQSLAEISYGPLALEMLRVGRSPQEALDGLVASDPHADVRQVAIISAFGKAAVHTGDNCIAEAGHRWGSGYVCQANLMRDSTVWDAMGEAFEKTAGDLATRMMAALEAAQAEGGDIRGKQSAAMIVVAPQSSGRPWDDRLIDIRVDDHPEPLEELRRLLNINRAYNLMNLGDELMAEDMLDEAEEAYRKASQLAPGNVEIMFWHAVTLVSINEVDRALPIFKEVFATDDAWRILVPRLVESELMPDDSDLIERIVTQ